MPRIYANFVKGLLSADLPLVSSGATSTMQSANLNLLPAVVTPNTLALTIGPDSGNPEIVVITAHTVGATTAQVLRGEEGTAPRLWTAAVSGGVEWRHSGTAFDFAAANDPSALDAAILAFGPSGVELGEGESTVLTSSSGTAVVIIGTSIVVPATTRPVDIIFGGFTFASNAGGSAFIDLYEDSGAGLTQVDRVGGTSSTNSALLCTTKASRRPASVSSRTYELRVTGLNLGTGGTANALGSLNTGGFRYPVIIQAVTV